MAATTLYLFRVISFEISKFPWRSSRAYSSLKSSETVFLRAKGVVILDTGIFRTLFKLFNLVVFSFIALTERDVASNSLPQTKLLVCQHLMYYILDEV